jgi:hypothetical protein
MHLQKRRHRQNEQADSRAKAIQKTEQGTRPQQKHTTSRGKGERKRAGNPLSPKSPVEETTHTTRAKHLTQHASKIALCLLFTISISGNNNRIGIKQNYSREENTTEKVSAPAEETAHCARRIEAEARSMRMPQAKSWGTGEPKSDQRLPSGGTNLEDRKCSAPPSTATEGYPTAVEAGGWTPGAPEEPGNRGKRTKSDTTNNRKIPNGNSEKTNTKNPKRPGILLRRNKGI